MDLSDPLTALATPTMARVLRVLAGTTMPLSGREIARIAALDTAGVWRVLKRLEEHGIVLADHRSQLTHYTANRDHLAWPAIEQLVRLWPTLRDRLTQSISAWTVQPLHASIFGSAARGEALTSSDLDVLLVHADLTDGAQVEQWASQLDQLRSDVRRWTGNSCQTFDIDLTRLGEHVSAHDPLVDNWLRDALSLAGQPLRDLIRGM